MIDVRTKILGLVGYPVEHSLSPLLHNQAIKRLNLNYVYLPLPIKPENLREGIEGIRALGVLGVNVTIPYKEKVIPFLDELDSLANKIGAVNTIKNNNGILKGYNTDVSGFARMVEKDGGCKIKGKKAMVIGAGGASKAVITALCSKGIKELYLLNRNEEKGKNLIEIYKSKFPDVYFIAGGIRPEFYFSLVKKIDLLVDTTPVGMAPKENVDPVIIPEALHSNLLVIDLVYNPGETTLIKAAKKRGAKTLNGLGMLIYQGSESFQIWTGYTPEISHWKKIIKIK